MMYVVYIIDQYIIYSMD